MSESVSQRLARLGGQTVRGGLLSVPDAAALAAAGFEPISEVVGAVANAVTPGGFYAAAPAYSSPYRGSQRIRTYTSSSHNAAVGTPPSVLALRAGHRTMLARLAGEARAVGADGVVGVTVERTVGHGNGTQIWRFLAVGTAVRSTGHTHTDTPFTTDLTGAQVGAAIRSGWIPLSLLIVPCMAVRWLDYGSRTQRVVTAGNVEVDAYTDVVNTCRHQARTDWAQAAAAIRAEAAVLSSMTLETEIKPDESTATVIVTGTALARFEVPAERPRPLTIMPLHGFHREDKEKR